jgi:hypothetical protein
MEAQAKELDFTGLLLITAVKLRLAVGSRL